MRRLVVATTNPAKTREIGAILHGLPMELTTLSAFPSVAAPDETGRTFAENARLKAEYYAAAIGELTVAEDSGLEIATLHGLPGVESARFGGIDSTYPQKFALLYEMLQKANAPGSPARFVCALCLVRGSEILFETEGAIEGRIAPEPAGEGGFGYDPIFFYPPFGKTLAQSADRKSAVSHRGVAFRALREYLESNVVASG
jgi:XTP/dITP diphosphohydrolase